MGLDDPDPRAMTSRFRVSVVIPAYNVGRFIDEALGSVAAQRHPAHEVIVVDDGSSDDTNARVRAWGDHCGPARLRLLDGPNRGLSRSRNRAIEAATGELIAFLDGDDCFLPWHLERLVPAFEADPGLRIAFGDLTRFREDQGELGGNLELIRAELRRISLPSDVPHIQRLGDELRAIFVEQSMILPSSWLVSREAIDKSGLFDPALAYGEDVDFFWRLTEGGGAVWHDGPTARRREHDSNASNPSRAAWSEPQLLRSAAKMTRLSPTLTPQERVALTRLLDRSVWTTGWLAAGQGIGSYLTWRRETADIIGRRAPLQPRLFVRALRASALS